MGYKETDPCIQKAYNDERLFVLMARDEFAPFTIVEWIKHSLHKQPLSKLIEALECAHAMANYNGPDIRARIFEEGLLKDRQKRMFEKETPTEKIKRQWNGEPDPALKTIEAQMRKDIERLESCQKHRQSLESMLQIRTMKKHARDHYEAELKKVDAEIDQISKRIRANSPRTTIESNPQPKSWVEDMIKRLPSKDEIKEVVYEGKTANKVVMKPGQNCSSCGVSANTLFDGLCDVCHAFMGGVQPDEAKGVADGGHYAGELNFSNPYKPFDLQILTMDGLLMRKRQVERMLASNERDFDDENPMMIISADMVLQTRYSLEIERIGKEIELRKEQANNKQTELPLDTTDLF